MSETSSRNRYISKQQANMISKIKTVDGLNGQSIVPCPPMTSRGPAQEENNFQRHRRPSEAWCGQTTGIIELSNAQRTKAKAMRDLSAKETENARIQTNTMIQTVNDKLSKKVAESTALLVKLRQGADSLRSEIERLIECRMAADGLLCALQRPLRKCERRQTVRSQRPPRENIDDTVQKAIVSERGDLLSSCQALTDNVEKCDRQIDAMKKVLHLLEEDIKDKGQAISVDKQCLILVTGPVSPPKLSRSEGASLNAPVIPGASEGPNRIAKSSRQPIQWKESSNVQIARAKELINLSLDLRSSIGVIMKRSREAQKASCTHVEESLRKKVQMTTALHQKLTKQRLTLHSDIERLKEQRQKVSLELADLTGPMEIVSRRLELRCTRPSREKVRDAVEEALETEYATLVSSINKLKAKLASIDGEHASLLQAQREVTMDLEDKGCALSLDQTCMETSSATNSSFSLPPVSTPSRVNTPRGRY